MGIVACALDMPSLVEASRARGLHLVPLAQAPADAAAAILPCAGDPRSSIAATEDAPWRGPRVLVLAHGCGVSVAQALDAGADDAVALPVSAAEIAARVAARVRGPVAPPLRWGPIVLDPIARTATRDGRPLPLLPREYALLARLVQARGGCVARAALLHDVLGRRFEPGTNVLEVHLSRLRAKLDGGAGDPLLVTERGRGYRLAGPAVAPHTATLEKAAHPV